MKKSINQLQASTKATLIQNVIEMQKELTEQASTKESLLKSLNELKKELVDTRAELQQLKKDISSSMLLDENDIYSLKGFSLCATWYNSECNGSGFNKVVELLINNVNSNNKENVSCGLQLLNSVALNQDLFSRLQSRSRKYFNE